MKNPKRKTLPIEDVFQLFQTFSDSNLSLAEFARQEEIPYSRLIHYRRRLIAAKLLHPLTNALLPQNLPNPTPSSFLQILPLSQSPKNSELEHFILKSSSFQLLIPNHFQKDTLSNILEVLKLHV